MKRKLFLVTVALFLLNVLTFAQQTTVKGTITSSDGQSLPGATVILKGTSIGTVTDIDGNYSISIEGVTDPILVISFIGYASQEVAVAGQATIDMVLSQDISDLDEVVVVGYGTQKKSLVTGAISKLSSDDLIATQPQRVEQAIQGKVSGVTVASESGSPGAGITIKIRGTSSNRNTDPLFIVDGMKTGGIDYLDPADIESIEILKDAASSAIYGAEGGNGVVLITTKKGKAGQAQVTYSTYYGTQRYIDKLQLLDGEQYTKYYQDALIYENAGKTQDQIDRAIEKQGLPAIGEPAFGNTNWLEEITRPAPMMSHNLGISGGSEKTNYSSSINYYKQEGITGGDKSQFSRFTARLNMEHKATDYLKVGVNATYSHRERKALSENSQFDGLYGNAQLIDPYTPTVYENESEVPESYAGEGFDDLFVRNGNGKLYGMSTLVKNEIVNPLARMQTAHGYNTEEKIKAGSFVEITPIEGLVFKTSYDIDVATQLNGNWSPAFFYHDLNKREFSTVDQTTRRYQTWQFDNILSYSKSIAEHSFSGMVGTHAEEYDMNELTGAGWYMIRESDAFSHPAITKSDTNDVLGGYKADPRRISSVFARFNYNYGEKYLLNITVRNDKSSMLSTKENPETGRSYQSGIFPSVSLGWVVSKESFWNVPAINFLKARYSYGENGSLGALTPFQYVPLIGFTGTPYTDGLGGRLEGATPEMLSNDALTWESTNMHNFGIDLRFLESKFSGTIEYYIKTTENLLTTAQTPGYAGNAAPQANLGTVVNNGLELELTYRQMEGEFQWDLGGNISFQKNEVTDFPGGANGASVGINQLATRIDEGEPIYYFYGYKTNGVWKDQADLDANNFYTNEETGKIVEIQGKAIPGDIKIIDTDGDRKITNLDRTAIGSPHPDVLLGLNFNAYYKDFDFGMNLAGSIGNDVYFGVVRNDLGKTNHPTYFLDDGWSPENTGAEFFRPSLNTAWNFQSNDMFVENGSYAKLKNITIGYTLPSNLTKKAQISKLRVYVAGNNLLTLTKYRGSDPEMGNTGGITSYGIDRGYYPQSRQFLAGLNVTF